VCPRPRHHRRIRARTGAANGDTFGGTGGYEGSLRENRVAMGIDWMNRHELSQAIPPAYTELIGQRLMEHIQSKVAA
jgi:hypothetical protein